jgi:hypothetical protein
MSITLTSNYQEVLPAAIVEIVDELIENDYTLEEVLKYVDYFGVENAVYLQELIDVVENTGSTLNELYDFAEEYGYDNIQYFEDYVGLLNSYHEEAIKAFIECFDVSDLQHFEETYEGCFESTDDFVDYVLEQGDYNIPDWICVDANATWNSALRFDYYEEDGYYFRHL